MLRLLLGEALASSLALEADQVCVLETNLDDISSEMIGYCIGRLWAAGALDVYTTAIQMKKSRPGVTLSVLCRPAEAAALEAILFRENDHAGRAPLAGQPTCIAADEPIALRPPGDRIEGESGVAGPMAPRASRPSSSRAGWWPPNATCRCPRCTKRPTWRSMPEKWSGDR